jgi:hypothetical protein
MKCITVKINNNKLIYGFYEQIIVTDYYYLFNKCFIHELCLLHYRF